MPDTPQHNHDEQKSQVQDYFSRTAESYVSSFSHKSGDDLQRLVELGEWDKGQQALDIATGGGHTALAIAPYVAQVTVSDLTTGGSGTIVLNSPQDGPLMPAFDTQAIGNALGWGLVDSID